MTVTAQTPVNRHVGNGVTTVFAYTFQLPKVDDLVVQVTDTNGVVATKTHGTDYAVNGIGSEAGGSITFTAAPASGHVVAAYRATALSRATDYQTAGDFLAPTVNEDFNRIWRAIQELSGGGAGVSTALRVPAGESLAALPAAAGRASRILAFDASGVPTLMVGVDSGSAAALALDLASADAAKGVRLIEYSAANAYTGGLGAFLNTTFGRTAAEIAAGVTPSNYAYRPLDIRRYGAVADDSTPCDAALQAAIKVAACIETTSAYLYPAATVYVPPGTFRLTGDNPLGSVDWTTLTGATDTRYFLRIRGDGLSSRLHWRPTGSVERWLYDNGASASADNRLAYWELTDLHVWMDGAGLSAGGTVNGFRLFGDTAGTQGVTQSLRLNGCRFAHLELYDSPNAAAIAKAGTLIKLLGNGVTMGNADATKVTRCSIRGLATALEIDNNDESVSHVFVDTDCETMFGDVFVLKSGGSLSVFGGSITMNSEGSAKYLISYPLGARQIAGVNSFHGVRLECNENVAGTGGFSGIINIDATAIATAYISDIAVTNFVGCNFYPISRAAGNTINLDSATRMVVNFIGCDGLDLAAHGVRWFSSIATRALTQVTGTMLNFRDGTAVPCADIVYDDADSVGRTSARNCRNTLDYDATVSGRFHTSGGANLRRKTAVIWGASWPDAGNNSTMSITLPKGAFLLSCAFRKAANGGAATAGYRLAMVDGASNQYCASGSANQNTEHKASAYNINMVLDDALGYVAGVSATQTIYLVALAGSLGSSQAVAMAATDYAIVEYV